LQHLVTLVDKFRAMYSKPDLRRALKVSPEHWFLGYELRRIFEKHLQQQATRSRKADGSRGPFVCFAVAVSSALDLHVSDATVSKAMTNLAPLFRRASAANKTSGWHLDEFGNPTRVMENS